MRKSSSTFTNEELDVRLNYKAKAVMRLLSNIVIKKPELPRKTILSVFCFSQYELPFSPIHISHGQ